MNITHRLLITLMFILSIVYINLVNCDAKIKWDYCYSEENDNCESREDCLASLFEGKDGPKYSYINIPDYPNNITVLNKLYTFTFFENENVIQIIGGLNTTMGNSVGISVNYTYPIVDDETNLYDDEPCVIIDLTDCYLAVMCNINVKDKNKRLAIALGLLVPILVLIVFVVAFVLYKRLNKRYSRTNNSGYIQANQIEIN